jgi:hypothetical protein
MKYKAVGNSHVLAGKKVIAISFLEENGYRVRILQGMNRIATVNKIIEDCPEFAKENNLTPEYTPKLFSESYLKHFKI